MRGLNPASSDCCEVPARSDNRAVNWVSVHSRGVPTSALPPGNNDPCRRVHRPQGQSPVGVSRRHRWPRSAHARRTTDPHPPSGVSPQLGSVPGGGQSPSQMCTLDPRPTNPPQMGPIAWCGQSRDGVSRRHKCARSAHARRTPGPHPPGGVSPRVGSVPGGGQSPSQMCTVRAGVLLSPPSRSSRPCAAGRRPARDRRTYIGSGAHYTADADN